MLRENQAVQDGMGADILLLEPDALKERFPWLDTDGVAGGIVGPQRRGLVRRLGA